MDYRKVNNKFEKNNYGGGGQEFFRKRKMDHDLELIESHELLQPR